MIQTDTKRTRFHIVAETFNSIWFFIIKSAIICFYKYPSIAQLVEQRTLNPLVAGSNPAGGTNYV